MATPFFSFSLSFSVFFGGDASLACHIFSFGATIVKHHILFHGCSKREFAIRWSIYWWMVVMLIFGVGISQVDVGVNVYVLLIEKA